MITSLMDMLFGCWHSNYSFPISAKRGERKSRSAMQTGTYVVCLDCGKEFPYDWSTMKVVAAEKEYQVPLEVSPVMAEVGSSFASKQAA